MNIGFAKITVLLGVYTPGMLPSEATRTESSALWGEFPWKYYADLWLLPSQMI